MYTNKYNCLAEIIIFPLAIVAIIFILNITITDKRINNNTMSSNAIIEENVNVMSLQEEFASYDNDAVNKFIYQEEYLISNKASRYQISTSINSIIKESQDKEVFSVSTNMLSIEDQYSVYCTGSTKIRESINNKDGDNQSVLLGEELTVIGIVTSHEGYLYVVNSNNFAGYIETKYTSTDKNSVCLNYAKGTIMGPSGKETYYNLPMDGIVRMMRNRGFSEEEYPYWIREDGCKMLGDYIMVAANLEVRPRGTIVETSLGTGLVCDTGGFAKNNPMQLDIATNW